VPPLQVYLGERDEMLMVSGFTDDKPIAEGNRRFADNLELSAQRALTVTRALIDEGMPVAACVCRGLWRGAAGGRQHR
jgi:flagellar motor protein MotB